MSRNTTTDRRIEELPIRPDDWERANSWKVPAMLHMTIDAGLRNKELWKSEVSWIDWDAKALRIPAEDAVKSDDAWTAALRRQTMLILERWVEERRMYDKYDGSDYLFLTRHGNPYRGKGLNRLLDRLCEFAGVDAENATWYSIRHLPRLGVSVFQSHVSERRDRTPKRARVHHVSDFRAVALRRSRIERKRENRLQAVSCLVMEGVWKP